MHQFRILVCVAATLIMFCGAAYSNAAHDQLSAMSDHQRSTALAAFLGKSGERCSEVTKTFYQGSDKKGNAFWNAACAGGEAGTCQ